MTRADMIKLIMDTTTKALSSAKTNEEKIRIMESQNMQIMAALADTNLK